MKIKLLVLLLLLSQCPAKSSPQFTGVENGHFEFQFNYLYEVQNYNYLLNNQEYSKNTYIKNIISLTKKLPLNDGELFIKAGFGSHDSQIRYSSASAINGQRVSETNISIQNPQFVYQLPLSYFIDENDEKLNLKDILYFEMTPAIFDQNATIKNSRLIQGHQLNIGYFRWIESEIIGYFFVATFRSGDKVIDSVSKQTLSRSDQNSQINFGLVARVDEYIRNLSFSFEIYQQLDKMIQSNSGGKTRSEGYDFSVIGINYQLPHDENDYLLKFKYIQNPKRNFKSGDYEFIIQKDHAIEIELTKLIF